MIRTVGQTEAQPESKSAQTYAAEEGDGAGTEPVSGRTEDDARNRPKALPIRRVIAPFLVGQRRRLGLISLSSAAGGFAEALVLVLIARVAFALTSDSSNVRVALGPIDLELSPGLLLGVTAVLVAIRLVLNIWQARISAAARAGVLADTRKSIVASYLGAAWSLQAAEREGRLQELLTTYAQFAASAVLSLSLGMVAAFNLLAFMATALAVNAPAAVGVAAAAALLGVAVRPIRGRVRRSSLRGAEANLEFATALTELVATTQVVRIFEVEQPVRDRLDTMIDRSATRTFRTQFLSALAPAVYQAIALLFVVAALALTYATGIGRLASLGAVVLIMLRSLTYAQALQVSIQNLHEGAPYFETLRDEEVRYALAAVPRAGDPVRAIGELAFERVSFEYVPGQPVLRDVSFQVRKGEIIGVVGPSGAGKSTLVQLLLRLRDPTLGQVLADGRDVRGLALEDWYHHVTFVPQDEHFFAGTVADNVRFFRDGVEEAAVERAARRAHLHNEIVAWPLGYDTPVGERGGRLSGGQRQRLSIARALVGEPDVVVLDEPTSALDANSEALMRDTLQALAPRTTVFVIAHRLSTLSICDRIMVIHGGELQSFDEPEQLEEDNPFYREALRLSGLR
jgi:ATP-binding cassette subfamily B protein